MKTVVINGSSYNIPEEGDENWGTYFSDTIEALATDAIYTDSIQTLKNKTIQDSNIIVSASKTIKDKDGNIVINESGEANKENTTLDTSTVKFPTNRLAKEYADTKIAKATNITAINDIGIADNQIALFNLSNKDIRTSSKTIATTVTSTDTTIPTSKAVVDYIDAQPIGLPTTPNVWNGQHPQMLVTSQNSQEESVGGGLTFVDAYPHEIATKIGTYTPQAINFYTISDGSFVSVYIPMTVSGGSGNGIAVIAKYNSSIYGVLYEGTVGGGNQLLNFASLSFGSPPPDGLVYMLS